MDAARLEAALEARVGDALSDLGSGAALVALCDGEPTRDGVLRATLAGERAAADTFARWAAAATDDRARSTFEATAAQERDHARRVAALMEAAGDEPPAGIPSGPGPLHAYLRGLADPLARVGAGLIGRPLASLRTYARVRRWATAAGDGPLRECFEGLADETEASVAAGADLVDASADGPDSFERALSAAAYAVEVVHDDYADALAARGLSFR